MLAVNELKDVQGKKVLVRVDFNVPLKEGAIRDDNRVVAALPTIQELINKGAKVILFSHLGKIKHKEAPEVIEAAKKKNNLAPVAKRLGELLKKEVKFANSTRGDEVTNLVNSLNNGDVFKIPWDSEEYEITYDRELVSSKPDKYKYTFETEIYDDVYSDDAEITIIKPVQLLIDDKSIASSYYIGHKFSVDEFNISVKYDDNKTEVKLKDPKLVSLAFEEKELKPGINHLRFTFDDGTYSFYTTKEVIMYDLTYNVKIGEAPDYKEQPFFEGQYFDNKFTAAVHYDAGVDKDGNPIKICDDVDVTKSTTYTPVTPFKAGINTLTFNDKYYLESEKYNVNDLTTANIHTFF